MEVLSYDTNRPRSRWASLDARWKLVALAAMVAAPFFLRSLPAAATAFGCSLVLLLVSRVPLRWLLPRLLALGLILVLVVVFLPFTLGEPFVNVVGIQVSLPGLERAGLILLRTLTMVSLMLWLVATTPFATILKAAAGLGLPSLVMTLLLVTHRYVDLFLEEIARLRIVLRTRGYRNRPSRRSYLTLGNLTGAMLVRSSERADRVGQAMQCRGFDGRLRLLTLAPSGRLDPVLMLCLLLLNVTVPLLLEWWLRRGPAV